MAMTLVEQLEATAELCGTKLSPNAALMLVEELHAYPEEQVTAALKRCRRELKGRLTIAEVVSRLADGRPGPDEAWAMLPWDDADSAWLTEEMAQAMGLARAAYLDGDRVGARMAFREHYTRLVTEARERRIPVHWSPSLGYDVTGRVDCLQKGVAQGLVIEEQVQHLLPPGSVNGTDPEQKLITGTPGKKLKKPVKVEGTLREVIQRLQEQSDQKEEVKDKGRKQANG